LDVYIVNTLQKSDRALKYLTILRRKNISAVMGYLDRSMKAQMRAAAKYRAKYALILEPDDDMVSARNMIESKQNKMPFNTFLDIVRENKSLKK